MINKEVIALTQIRYGMRLADHKAPAALLPVAAPRFAGERLLPLSLSAGTAKPQATGALGRGALLYTDENGFETHLPTAGEVGETTVLQHPLYGTLSCVSLTPAELPEQPLSLHLANAKLTPQQVMTAARRAGIVDELSGTPLCEVLGAAADSRVFLVVDATEAQPFASSAFAVLRDEPTAVAEGMAMAATAIHAVGCHIAFCPVNRDMKEALAGKYAAGVLFETKRQYPVTAFADGDVPTVCIGVQATAALYAAIKADAVPAAVVVTVAGDAVETPQNVRVPIGVSVEAVLAACGVKEDAVLVAGDAVTGVRLTDTAVPVLPGMTCLLALKALPVAEAGPCIGCGNCAAACHARLLPYEIARRVENMHYERLAQLHPEDCDGCGACSCVCPAGREVMHEVLRAQETGGTVFLNWGGDALE